MQLLWRRRAFLLAKILFSLLLLDQLLFWTMATRPAASLRALIELTGRDAPPFYRLQANLNTQWTLWTETNATQVHTNSLYFRGPEHPLAKPAGVRRVVMVGDSVTFGIGVNDAETLPVQLQKMVTPTEVEIWNCGVPGYAMADFVGQFPSQILPLQPDLVLFQLSRNDSLVPLHLTPMFLSMLRFSGLARAYLLVRFNLVSDHAAYAAELREFLSLAQLARVPLMIWPEGVPDRAHAELLEIARMFGAEVRAIDPDTIEKLDGDPHFSARGNVQAAQRLMPLVLGRLNGTLPLESTYP